MQRWLAENWLPLAQSGILYPSVEAAGVAQNLKAILCEAASTDPLPAPHDALAYRALADQDPGRGDTALLPPATAKTYRALPGAKQMLKTLQSQIRQLAPEVVVLSSELMSHWGDHAPDAITQLQTLFQGADVEIYCSLQRPDQFLAAIHGRRLEMGAPLPNLADAAENLYLDTVYFDYCRLLTPWRDAFPKAKLHLRNAASVEAAGGLIEDFTNQVTTAFPASLTNTPSVPPLPHMPLPYAAQAILQHANGVSRDPVLLKTLQTSLANSHRRHPAPANDQVELLGAPQRAKLHAAFVPLHDQLSSWAGTPEGLFPDLDAMRSPQAKPLQQVTPRVLKTLLRHTWPILQPKPMRLLLRSLKRELAQ